MAMLAHFEELPQRSERRRSVRRALKLGVGEGGNQVTIRDLSLTGALLESPVPMLVGSAFELDLPKGGKIDATVVWSSGEYYGCQFDLPISPSVLSNALVEAAVDAQSECSGPDPLSELRGLSLEVEALALKMERALKRLSHD